MLAVFLDSGQVSIRQLEVPRRLPGYALIRLRVAGICNTDLELQRGYYGFSGVPGHEFVGEVIESDTGHLMGRRVVGEINLACGRCGFCRAGLGRHCESRTVLGIVKHPGAFAEFLTLPDANLRVVPDHVSDEQAVFTEPLAAACEILEQVALPPGVEAAVLGDGKLGLLIAQTLLAHGARVTVYGRHAEKLKIAQRAGAVVTNSTDRPNASFPFVIESTGSADGLREAISMVRPRGTVIMKSTIHNQVSIDMAPVIVNEITLVGSRCGLFEPALELLSAGKVEVAGMISAEFPLAEARAAFAEAASPGVLKVLLRNVQTS
jgi:2-desacetyl-2-hydroxyethyl bacteriochlorophyllide A dehydrogenase